MMSEVNARISTAGSMLSKWRKTARSGYSFILVCQADHANRERYTWSLTPSNPRRKPSKDWMGGGLEGDKCPPHSYPTLSWWLTNRHACNANLTFDALQNTRFWRVLINSSGLRQFPDISPKTFCLYIPCTGWVHRQVYHWFLFLLYHETLPQWIVLVDCRVISQ